MSMNTGENEQGLRKVIDLTRMISILLLLIHCYFYCYAVFQQWNFTTPVIDRILKNLAQTGLFGSFVKSKLIALFCLLISLIGVKGRKSEKIKLKTALMYFATGIVIYFGSVLSFDLFSSAVSAAGSY